MTAYVCVHGHAYQPPRENPQSGEVERQQSAEPYHDWNERITAECYFPLSKAKRLNEAGATVSTANLYESVSFDLGPTLGVWLDRRNPGLSTTITMGDSAGGGAMAHPWVHAILPLTPAGDRATIVRWGVDEFRSRFGRAPLGMWLPETAVDTASLEALADVGIRWTMLAPHQIYADHGATGVTPAAHQPLMLTLPSGRSMTIVPYDGELSHGIAFGGLLRDGQAFADAVANKARSAAQTEPNPLVVLSTDIETFGHHHQFGEMALAHAMELWRAMGDIEVVTAERYLQMFPATQAGRLVENTSWSCAHGVERWRSDCGCRFEQVSGQDQRWRRPLRDVLVAVADVAGRLLNDHSGGDLVDPWAARYDYGMVLGSRPDRRQAMQQQFLARHMAPGGDPQRVWQWMEAERLRLEAWSSCAWFFDTADRIETRQTLAEAREALRRLGQLTERDLMPWFNDQLSLARLSDAAPEPVIPAVAPAVAPAAAPAGESPAPPPPGSYGGAPIGTGAGPGSPAAPSDA
ncbi:MAG: DUF3536 domain-containing protein [Microthrixaceae bacterium]|nr:DUF3536 domain-containing protein [Microthrixaceae bacterium]